MLSSLDASLSREYSESGSGFWIQCYFPGQKRGDEVDLSRLERSEVRMALRSSTASLGKRVKLRRGMGSEIWKGGGTFAEDGDEPGRLGGVEGLSKPADGQPSSFSL
jgi:hypothetical protein